MSNTKTIGLLLAGVALVGLIVCGAGGAIWYFKLHRGAAVPDVGPLAGQALTLPADSAVLAGFDARAFFGSAGYKQVASGDMPALAQTLPPAEAEQLKKQMREGVEKGLKEAEDKIGIRLDRDLERLVLAVASVGAPTPEAALIALGRFDRAKVTRAVEAAAKGEGAAVTSRTVEGISVQAIAAPGKPGAELAFLDDTMLVVGTPGAVGSVVASHAKRTRPLEGNLGLLGLVKRLDPASGYWIVIDEPLIGRVQKETGGAPVPVPLPRNLTLAGKFDGGMELTAEMADEAAAKSLVQMAEQGLGMARAQAAQSPEVQKLPGAKELLDGVKVTADAKTVKLSIPGAAGGSTALGGVIAAAAIPSLLRARTSANEASAIGDIRTIISAEMAFASSSGGWYGDLGCLAEPKSCLEGYTGPAFLDQGLANATEKSGYRRAFQTGPSASPRGYSSFAYTAMPATPGQTGVRSFCGDATGLVCADPSGAEIVPQAGACPGSCAPLDGAAPPPPPPLPPRAEDAAPPRPRPPVALRKTAPVRAPEAAPPPAAPPAPEPPAPAQPLRVGGDVHEPKKLKNVNPQYPAIARQARVQGIVILEATIGPQGRVSDVRVLRGIPMLDAAAVEAVRQWVYEPTLLNGVPVPVIMTVTVRFQMK